MRTNKISIFVVATIVFGIVGCSPDKSADTRTVDKPNPQFQSAKAEDFKADKADKITTNQQIPDKTKETLSKVMPPIPGQK